MEFEFVLLDTLMESECIEKWKQLIEERLSLVSGDDFSMCALVLGFKNFDKVRKAMRKRHKYLKKNYISKLKDEKSIRELWEEYKEEYYA